MEDDDDVDDDDDDDDVSLLYALKDQVHPGATQESDYTVSPIITLTFRHHASYT